MFGFKIRRLKLLTIVTLLSPIYSNFLLDQNGHLQVRNMPGKCISTLDENGLMNSQPLKPCEDKSSALRWTFDKGSLCSGAQTEYCLVPDGKSAKFSKSSRKHNSFKVSFDGEFIKVENKKSGEILCFSHDGEQFGVTSCVPVGGIADNGLWQVDDGKCLIKEAEGDSVIIGDCIEGDETMRWKRLGNKIMMADILPTLCLVEYEKSLKTTTDCNIWNRFCIR